MFVGPIDPDGGRVEPIDLANIPDATTVELDVVETLLDLRRQLARLNPTDKSIRVGGAGESGELVVRDSADKVRFRLSGGRQVAELGARPRLATKPVFSITIDRTVAAEIGSMLGNRSRPSGIITSPPDDGGTIEPLDLANLPEASTVELNVIETLVDLRRQVAELERKVAELSNG